MSDSVFENNQTNCRHYHITRSSLTTLSPTSSLKKNILNFNLSEIDGKIWIVLPNITVVVESGVKHHQTINYSWFVVAGLWFSPGTPVSSMNKTDRHDRSEMPNTILEGDHPKIISAKFGWDWLSSFRGEVPKFELYKHNDELFNIYYRIFYEFWTFTDFDRLCKVQIWALSGLK
jgi:hypothetical protein